MACSGPAPLTPQDAPGNDSPVLTIGVVSDTHIPDRVHSLHPGIVPALRAAGVKHILHAGDICLRGVLDELSSLAPVTAARGNRDLLLTGLRMVEHLELGGARIALLHGHGGLGPYLLDKINCILQGYQLERYLSRILRQVGSQAQVIVFGHTHYPVLTHYAGQLLFNPGSASFGPHPSELPRLGLLHVSANHQVTAEFILLHGWRIKNRRWIAI